MSLASMWATIETFAAKEVKGAENLVAKIETAEKNIVPELQTILTEAENAYKAISTAVPYIEADALLVAKVIAEISILI